jgi:uncharacterized membrane protein
MSKGRIATLLIILLPIITSITSMALFSFRVLPGSMIYVSIIFSLPSYAAYILFLVAMNGLAKYYNAFAIFRNSLYGVITSIVGGITLAIITYAFVIPTLDKLITTPITPGTIPPLSVFLPFLRVMAVVWVIMFVIALVEGIFFRSAFYALAEKSGESNFRTAGLLMLIGGVLTIIIVCGLIFIIGWIFAAMGFFSLKAKATQTYPQSPSFERRFLE